MTCNKLILKYMKNIVFVIGFALRYLSIWFQSPSKSMKRMFVFKQGFYFHEQEGYGNLRGDNFYMHES